ncbi:MAG: LysR family transcriptional regulator [Myxococcota bacterium]|nr:LysR family transcriptional regulator [Myxococcota bacterium]
MKLDLNHLEALEAVAESGSFAKAAERLNKVRSAVSYDVRCLEEQLSLVLMDRSGYRAKLTDAGAMILKEGRPILRQARMLENLAVRLGQDWEPTLRVVMEGAIPLEPVMRVIEELNRRQVPTVIDLETEFLGGVPDRYEREEADLMLVKDFDANQDEYVICQLPDVHCVLAVAVDHPMLEGSPESVTLHDLRPYLELNIQVAKGGAVEMVDKRIDVPRVLNLSGFYAKKEALLRGLGFGWIPRALIADELQDGRLAVVPLDEGDGFHFTPVLMHRKDRPLGKAGVLFRDLVVAQFHNLD